MRQTARMTCLATAIGLAFSMGAAQAQKKDDKTAAADPRQTAISALVSATNEAMKGAPGTTVYTADAAAGTVTADPSTQVAMTFAADFLKATDNKIYAPFTVTVQPSVLGQGGNFGVYIRLAPQGAQPPAAPPPLDEKARKEKEKQDRRKKKGKEAQDLTGEAVSGVEYPWEDYYDLTAVPRGPGGPLTFSRPFSVPAGTYDAYVAVLARDAAATAAPAAGAAAAAPMKIAVHKTELTVPDYWGPEFQLSSVFVANKIGEITNPPTGEEQKQKPYVIGQFEIVPAPENRIAANEELFVLFFIYGAQLGEDKKPDITIEWQPYKKGPLGESKYKSIAPQQLNAETLPPGFDPSQGHQLVGSINGIPASALDPGDYRLAIKVTDNKSGKSLTHDVAFTVAGS